MGKHDVITVGSGHNALVAAALLARAGQRVLMLERNDRVGGFVRRLKKAGLEGTRWQPAVEGRQPMVRIQVSICYGCSSEED